MARPHRRQLPIFPPYVKWYVSNFLEGCIGARMTLEQVGFYAMLLCLHWQVRGPLPDNVPAIAKALGIDGRITKRVIDEIVALGPKKLTRQNGQLFNPRLMREIGRYQQLAEKPLQPGQLPLPLPPVRLPVPQLRNPLNNFPTGPRPGLLRTRKNGRFGQR